jgi:hypothetical protein
MKWYADMSYVCSDTGTTEDGRVVRAMKLAYGQACRTRGLSADRDSCGR